MYICIYFYSFRLELLFQILFLFITKKQHKNRRLLLLFFPRASLRFSPNVLFGGNWRRILTIGPESCDATHKHPQTWCRPVCLRSRYEKVQSLLHQSSVCVDNVYSIKRIFVAVIPKPGVFRQVRDLSGPQNETGEVNSSSDR